MTDSSSVIPQIAIAAFRVPLVHMLVAIQNRGHVPTLLFWRLLLIKGIDFGLLVKAKSRIMSIFPMVVPTTTSSLVIKIDG